MLRTSGPLCFSPFSYQWRLLKGAYSVSTECATIPCRLLLLRAAAAAGCWDWRSGERKSEFIADGLQKLDEVFSLFFSISYDGIYRCCGQVLGKHSFVVSIASLVSAVSRFPRLASLPRTAHDISEDCMLLLRRGLDRCQRSSVRRQTAHYDLLIRVAQTPGGIL